MKDFQLVYLFIRKKNFSKRVVFRVERKHKLFGKFLFVCFESTRHRASGAWLKKVTKKMNTITFLASFDFFFLFSIFCFEQKKKSLLLLRCFQNITGISEIPAGILTMLNCIRFDKIGADSQSEHRQYTKKTQKLLSVIWNYKSELNFFRRQISRQFKHQNQNWAKNKNTIRTLFRNESLPFCNLFPNTLSLLISSTICYHYPLTNIA